MLFFALCFIVVLCIAYYYLNYNYDYWLKRNIKFEKPLPLFGNALNLFFVRQSSTQMITELYFKYPEAKVVGFFTGNHPNLIIRDPGIAKQIIQTNFSSFYARGLISNQFTIETLNKNLLFVDGDLWKLLRQRLTPAFTSGKIKAMFPIIIELSEQLQGRITTLLSKDSIGHELDAKDLMARFSTDFIGAVGFGLNSDSLQNDNSALRKLGKEMITISSLDAIKGLLKEIFPVLFKHIKLQSSVEKEMIPLVLEILKKRNYKPSNRHDFIDLLLECQMKGTIVGDSIEKKKPDGSPEQASVEVTDLLIAAQVFILFAAGFETTSSATSFTLHQLAFHPDKQRKVHEEIDRVLAKYDNMLCYDALKEMTYLEWSLKEAIRIFSPVGQLMRRNQRKYTIPEINLTIEKGIAILIPLQAFHTDPKYFENPEEFRPERFSSEESNSNNNFTYLPFGAGPRACIGERLGLMQSLAGLAAVLAKYNVSVSHRTVRHPHVDPRSHIVQSLKDELPLLFTYRNCSKYE